MEIVPAKKGNFDEHLSIEFSRSCANKSRRFFFFFYSLFSFFKTVPSLYRIPARMEEEKDATNAQILWSACTALARAIKSGPPGAPIEKIVRPLESEIKAVCKAARKCIQFKFNL